MAGSDAAGRGCRRSIGVAAASAERLPGALVPPGSATLAQQRVRAAWLFLAPMLVALAPGGGLAAGCAPSLFSFTDANLSDLDNWEFVGLANYVYLFEDPLWWRAVGNTLFFTVISVGAGDGCSAWSIALTLNAHMPGRGLLRAAVLIPWAIPTVVSAKMWGWMLHDLYGVVNAMLLSARPDRPAAGPGSPTRRSPWSPSSPSTCGRRRPSWRC